MIEVATAAPSSPAPITLVQARRQISIDEWLGYALLALIAPPEWRRWIFAIGLVVHVLVTYGVSYPAHWREVEAAGQWSPLRWVRRRWRR